MKIVTAFNEMFMKIDHKINVMSSFEAKENLRIL